MPIFSTMALTVQQQPSWTEKFFKEDGTTTTSDNSSRIFDDSLTSLSWLHNLNIMGEIHPTTLPTPPASPGPLNSSDHSYDSYVDLRRGGGGGLGSGGSNIDGCSSNRNGIGLMGPPRSSSSASSTGNCVLLQGTSSAGHASSSSSSSSSSTSCLSSSASSSATGRKHRTTTYQMVIDNVDYKTNGDVKPPYSYATLICMAMKANKNKMSLSAIYKWIRDNFMYYRRADTGWQNSIRHNLSLNKCFIKVPRNKDEPGKGGFWRLDPKYAEEMADGTFKKRRMANRPVPKKPVVSVTTIKKDGAITTTTDGHCQQQEQQQQQQHSGPSQQQQQQQQLTTYFLQPPVPSLQQASQDPCHSSTMQSLESSLMPLTVMSAHPIATTSLSPSTGLELHGINSNNVMSAEDEAETEAATASLKGDFCWNSVLNEDIEVDGLRYKTLDIVDMDGVTVDLATTYRTALSHLQCSSSMVCHHHHHHNHHHHHHHDGVGGLGCLDSPALSLDDDDLLVSDTSNDLSETLDLTTVHDGHVATSDWWRLSTSDGSSPMSSSTASSSMAPVTATDVGTPILLGHLGAGATYDMSGTAAASFLGHDWDDASRPVLEGALDLDGFVDLDVY